MQACTSGHVHATGAVGTSQFSHALPCKSREDKGTCFTLGIPGCEVSCEVASAKFWCEVMGENLLAKFLANSGRAKSEAKLVKIGTLRSFARSLCEVLCSLKKALTKLHRKFTRNFTPGFFAADLTELASATHSAAKYSLPMVYA